MKSSFRVSGWGVVLVLLVLSDAFASQPAGSLYLEGASRGGGLVLVHGRGKHPDWKVVGPLRREVNEQLGLHTLSLKMPYSNTRTPFRKYAAVFPDAFDQVDSGIRFLRSKGVSPIYLMGHSMGARMVTAFMAEQGHEEVEGLVIVGGRNNGGYPFSCYENLQNVKVEVLDTWGGGNRKDSDAAAERSEYMSDRYKQIPILGANHKFDGYEDQLVSVVIDWLRQQLR